MPGLDIHFECLRTVVVAIKEYEKLLEDLRESAKATLTIKDIYPIQAATPMILLMPTKNSTPDKVIEILRAHISQDLLQVVTRRGITVDITGSPQQRTAFEGELSKDGALKAVFGGRFTVAVPRDELNNVEVAHIPAKMMRIAANLH